MNVHNATSLLVRELKTSMTHPLNSLADSLTLSHGENAASLTPLGSTPAGSQQDAHSFPHNRNVASLALGDRRR